MEPTSPDTVSQRRSARVTFRCRAVLSGNDSNGLAFRAEADTLEVSLHGARIRCDAPLQVGMELRITIPGRSQSRMARVVWERITGEREFGIELHAPASFWGIRFGPGKTRPQTVQATSPVVPIPAVAENPLSEAPLPEKSREAKPQGIPERDYPQKKSDSLQEGATSSVEIPQEGIAVLVSGISISRMAFQENAILKPQSNKKASLTMSRIVDTGVMLRVIFPVTNQVMFVRVSEVVSCRQTKDWEVWVELLGDLGFVRMVDGRINLTW